MEARAKPREREKGEEERRHAILEHVPLTLLILSNYFYRGKERKKRERRGGRENRE